MQLCYTYLIHLPVFFRVASLVLGQPHDCLSASEVTLKDMGEIHLCQTTTKLSKTEWKHFPRYWRFVWGIHWSPVNSPHKGQWRGALMFSFTCAWINGWVNNREAGDLRYHRTHYDVTAMIFAHIVSMSPHSLCMIFKEQIFALAHILLLWLYLIIIPFNVQLLKRYSMKITFCCWVHCQSAIIWDHLLKSGDIRALLYLSELMLTYCQLDP